MSEPFDSDFSYGFYLKLLDAHRPLYDLKPLEEFDPSIEGRLYLRHDVDLCIDSAIAMAEIEAAHGIAATYMFIPTSPLYQLEARRSDLRRLRSLGHEVAIHFDVTTSEVDPDDEQAILAAIDAQCDSIGDLTGEPVRSVSFHRPLSIFLRGPDKFGGRVNAYSKSLMDHYRSDSAGRWREGNPLRNIPDAPIAQLLTHPIWWGPEHSEPDVRLEMNFRRRTNGLPMKNRDELSALLEATVPGVIRRNSPNKTGMA